MHYFTLIGFQHIVVALFLGLLAVLFIYVGWRYYPEPGDRQHSSEEVHLDHEDTSGGVPPFLIFLYVGVILWIIGYVIIEGIRGGAIF